MLALLLPRVRIRVTLALTITLFLHSWSLLAQTKPQPLHTTLPVVFEANRGQGPAWARYLARTSEGEVSLGADRIEVIQPKSVGGQSFEIRFRGAHPSGYQEESMHGGVANYYYGGSNPRRIEQIPLYRSVRYKDLLPGIDGSFHGHDGRLEYDFELAPHASTDMLQIDLSDDESAIPQEDGSLSIQSGGHSIRLLKPEAFQNFGGQTIRVPVEYRNVGPHSVGFKVDSYDRDQALIIDPVVSYAEIISVNNSSSVSAVAVDASGDLILTGTTFSADFPVINGQPGSPSGSEQVFVTKFDPTGENIIYSTYLPAGFFSTVAAIAVDASGDAFVAGVTGDPGFPVTSHELGACSTFCNAGFVTKLDPSGAVVYSTLLGSGQILPKAITIDASGHALVSGLTTDDTLKTTNAYQAGCFSECAFYAELNSNGTGFVFSSYLGFGTSGWGVALDSTGNIYVAGIADSVYGAVFPLKNELQSANGAYFLSKFAPDGKTLLFSTFLGGYPIPNASDYLAGVAVGPDGTIYLGGSTGSDGFPLTLDAYHHPTGEPSNPRMFAMAINPSLSDLKYSTDLGDGYMTAMQIDSSGDFYAAASTAVEPIQPLNAVTADVTRGGYYLELDPSGSPLQMSTLGGEVVDESPVGLAVDHDGNIYMAGSLGGSNPFVYGCQQNDPILVGSDIYGGQSNGIPSYCAVQNGIFVAKVAPDNKPQISVSQNLPFIHLHNVGSADLNISSITFSGGLEKAAGTCGNKVAAGTTCVLALSDANGKLAQGTYTINSDASPSSQTFTPYLDPKTVGGSVQDYLFVDLSQLNFVPQFAGTKSAPNPMRITNAGITNLTLNAIRATPYLYETNDCPATLAPSAYCTVQVGWDTKYNYQSDAIGIAWDGNAEVDDNFFGSYTISPTSLMLSQTNPMPFGSETQGNPSLYRTITITNVNTSAVASPSVTVSGDSAFSLVGNTCPASLAPQQSCVVGVSMDSSGGIGQHTANVNFSGSLSTAVEVWGVINAQQVITASASQLQWQPVLLGASSEQDVTLTNSSTTVASITKVSAITSDYSETDNCTANPLPAGASCTVHVTFSPQGLGARDDALTVQTDPGAAPLLVYLSGQGQYQLNLSPSLVDFGSGNLVGQSSAAQNLTITNETSASIAYTLTVSGPFTYTGQCPNPLPANGNCTIALTYLPTAVEFDTGILTVTATGSSLSNTSTLIGTSTQGAIMNVGTNLAFPNTVVGQKASSTVSISNTGKQSISNVNLRLNDGDTQDFSVTSGQCSSIPIAGSCTATVSFTPTVQGTRWASLLITSNASNSPRIVSLTGEGLVAVGASLSPQTLSFGNQDTGSQSAASSVTLTNTGTDLLTITGITSSSDFPQTNTCGSSLAASATCQISVQFAPSSAGPETGTLTITDNAGTQTVALSGTGTAPKATVGASVSPQTLSFGNQNIGSQSAASSVTLTNTGTGPLTISGIMSSPDFPQTNTCGSSLAAAASCQISVQFGPSNAGPETGTLTITDNAGTQTVALSGTGTASTITIGATTSGSLTSTVTSGQTASYALAVTGSAGFSGTVTLACSGIPQYGACTLSPTSLQVTPGSSTPFTVTITTQTPASQASEVRQLMPLSMFLLCCVFARRFRKSLVHMVACIFALIVLGGLSGCGGGSSMSTTSASTTNSTPAGTYHLTVTATSGTTQSTQSLTLVVQ